MEGMMGTVNDTAERRGFMRKGMRPDLWHVTSDPVEAVGVAVGEARGERVR